jgi:hypothetical protein
MTGGQLTRRLGSCRVASRCRVIRPSKRAISASHFLSDAGAWTEQPSCRAVWSHCRRQNGGAAEAEKNDVFDRAPDLPRPAVNAIERW